MEEDDTHGGVVRKLGNYYRWRRRRIHPNEIPFRHTVDTSNVMKMIALDSSWNEACQEFKSSVHACHWSSDICSAIESCQYASRALHMTKSNKNKSMYKFSIDKEYCAMNISISLLHNADALSISSLPSQQVKAVIYSSYFFHADFTLHKKFSIARFCLNMIPFIICFN